MFDRLASSDPKLIIAPLKYKNFIFGLFAKVAPVLLLTMIQPDCLFDVARIHVIHELVVFLGIQRRSMTERERPVLERSEKRFPQTFCEKLSLPIRMFGEENNNWGTYFKIL